MKGLRVHVAVEDLAPTIFYFGALFGAEAQKVRTRYARWILDDPRTIFAISLARGTTGISPLDLQAENKEELAEIETPVEAAGGTHARAEETHGCCYARARQGWVTAARVVHWEAVLTRGDSDTMARSVLIDA